jgi:hypothetical protein
VDQTGRWPHQPLKQVCCELGRTSMTTIAQIPGVPKGAAAAPQRSPAKFAQS